MEKENAETCTEAHCSAKYSVSVFSANSSPAQFDTPGLGERGGGGGGRMRSLCKSETQEQNTTILASAKTLANRSGNEQ